MLKFELVLDRAANQKDGGGVTSMLALENNRPLLNVVSMKLETK